MGWQAGEQNMIVRETGAPSTPLSTSPAIIVNTVIITICCLNNRQSYSEEESQPKESMVVEEACPHRPLEQCVNPLLQFRIPHLLGLCWFFLRPMLIFSFFCTFVALQICSSYFSFWPIFIKFNILQDIF